MLSRGIDGFDAHRRLLLPFLWLDTCISEMLLILAEKLQGIHPSVFYLECAF